MGVGVGKTRTTLEYLRDKEFKTILIIGTKKGVDVWGEQIVEHGFNFDLLNLKDGVVKDRAFHMLKQYKLGLLNIVVMNYEAFVKPVMFERLMLMKFDALVFDEVHRLRHHTTKASKLAFKLAHLNPSASRIGLTGTLYYNNPLDVFGIFRFIDKNVFGTKWLDFKTRYAIWRGQFNQIPVKFVHQDELKAKVDANSFYVDRTQVQDLPEEQHIYRSGVFTDTERKQYDELEKEFITLLGDEKITASTVMDKVNKLQQFTAGFVYKDNKAVPASYGKEEVLKSLLEEIGEQDVVIFYKYVASQNIIRNSIESSNVPVFVINGSESGYEDWKRSTVPSVLLVQIQSGAESLDFTKSDITIFYDMIYTYGQWIQALGRTSRGNQKSKSVAYYYLTIKNSIDENIVLALEKGTNLIDQLLRAST